MALSECATITDLYDRELVEHGDIAFPIAGYLDDLSSEDVPWHWHDEWEIAIVIKGSPEFYLEKGHFPLYPGEGIFINSRALHAVKQQSDEQGILHSLVFHPRLIGSNPESIFWQKLVQPLMNRTENPEDLPYLVMRPEVTWQKEVLTQFHTAWESLRTEALFYEYEVRHCLSKGMAMLIQKSDLRGNQLSEQEKNNANRIRQMLEFIDQHYEEDLTADKIAASASVSVSSCLRCFHQMIGTSPMQYVKQLRLRKANNLLEVSNKTVKEIALECGFNDISYFTKSFREQYRMTPGQFRKEQRALS